MSVCAQIQLANNAYTETHTPCISLSQPPRDLLGLLLGCSRRCGLAQLKSLQSRLGLPVTDQRRRLAHWNMYVHIHVQRMGYMCVRGNGSLFPSFSLYHARSAA